MMDEGTLCSQGAGGGGGNDGAVRTRVFVPPSCALGKGRERERERDAEAGHPPEIPAPVLAAAPTWEGKARRNPISHVCTVPPLPSHHSHLPFHPVPSPLPFLSPAEWSYLVLDPPLQKLFHPCLHSF